MESREWMNLPPRPANCPPGLEYLVALDKIMIHQIVEIIEVISGYETKNKYYALNMSGQKIYILLEKSNLCLRNFCSSRRPFCIKVEDVSKNEVIRMDRPLKLNCCHCCFPCCLQCIKVFAPPGQLVGSVKMKWKVCRPHFDVKDAEGKKVFLIKGPCVVFKPRADVNYKVFSTSGTQVGLIVKIWSGLRRELTTDADVFGINFPPGIDVKMKAVLIGACVLIDFNYYEENVQLPSPLQLIFM